MTTPSTRSSDEDTTDALLAPSSWSRFPSTLEQPRADEDDVSVLRLRIAQLQARNEDLRSEVRTRGIELKRIQTEHQALLQEFESMLTRVREVRARDRAAILEKEEDAARMQERLLDIEEHNRLQAEQLTKLTTALKDAIKEKDAWTLEDKGDEGRKERLLSAKENMIESGQKRIASLTRQLTALRQQFDAQRVEATELRRALADRNDDICALQARVSGHAFVESDRIERLEAERRAAEDTIHALNGNNRRLLMLLATPPPPMGWAQYLCYSGVANEMVYIGDHVVSANAPAAPAMSAALLELHAAVEAYNQAQSRTVGKSGLRQHINDRPVVAAREKDYWIPNDIFVLMSSFKHRHFPDHKSELFYELLIDMNKVWHNKSKKQKAAIVRSVSATRRSASRPPPHQPSYLDMAQIKKEVALMQKVVQSKTSGANTVRLWESATQTIQALLTRVSDLEALRNTEGIHAQPTGAFQYLCRRVSDVMDETTVTIENVVADCLKCLAQVPTSSSTPFALLEMQKDFLRTIQRSVGECRRHVLDAVTRAQCMI